MPHVLHLPNGVEYRSDSLEAATQFAAAEPFFGTIEQNVVYDWTCSDPRFALIRAVTTIQTIGAADAAAQDVLVAHEMRQPGYLRSRNVLQEINAAAGTLRENAPIRLIETVHSDTHTEEGDFMLDTLRPIDVIGCWWLNNMLDGAEIQHQNRAEIADALRDSGFPMQGVTGKFVDAASEARLRVVKGVLQQVPSGREYAIRRIESGNAEGIVLEGDHVEIGALANFVPFSTLSTAETHLYFDDDTWVLRGAFDRMGDQLPYDTDRMTAIHGMGYIATGTGVSGGTIPILGVRTQA